MFKSSHVAALAALSTAIASPVSAQSFRQDGYRDRTVSVGLTIPFGNGGSRAEQEPRMELVFDHRQRDANGLEVRDSFNRTTTKTMRLGFSLAGEPKMMMNGREMPEFGVRKNISTGVWIGLGVLTAAGIGLLVISEGLDCDADEECN